MPIAQSLASRLGTIFGFFLEVPEVARFVSIAETAGGLTVPPNPPAPEVSDRHIQNIHAPGLVGGALAVIFFRTSHAGEARFSLRLNSTPLTQRNSTEGGFHSWHEIIPAGALRPQNNELIFSVSAGGRVTFSDVVILYTSNKLTIRRPVVTDLTSRV